MGMDTASFCWLSSCSHTYYFFSLSELSEQKTSASIKECTVAEGSQQWKKYYILSSLYFFL